MFDPYSGAPLTMTNESPLTRGHRKKERTRKKLIESAMMLLSERDVGELTLYGLAEAAEMANGTVYNYFDSKEAVLDAVAVELAGRFSAQIDLLNQTARNASERVATGMRLYIRRAASDLPWARTLLRVVNFHAGLNSAFVQFVRMDLRLGIEAGEFKVDNEDVAIDLIVGTGLTAIRAVVEGRASPDYGEQLARLMLRGLGVSDAKAARAAFMPLPDPPSEDEIDDELHPVRKPKRPLTVVDD